MDNNKLLLNLEVVCNICGENHLLNDCTLVKITNHIADNEIPSRAKLSIPHFLQLQIMSDGSYSIVTQILLEKGTKFGPLIAPTSFTNNPAINFVLKLFIKDKNGSSESYLDTNSENECNWLIFIAAAQYLEEQNLICYQDDGKIYYVAIKDIPAGECLKVWYSPRYGIKMQKTMLKSQNIENDPLQNVDINVLLKKQQKIIERKQWSCKFCTAVETDITGFAKHLILHYTAQLKKKCEICKQSFNSKKSLATHLKIVHYSNFPQMQINKSIKSSSDSSIKLPVKDTAVGGPLLNDLFTDSSDLQQTDLEQFNLTMDNQNLLFDNVNLTMENLLSENVKDLDHFNFEIDDDQKQYVCDICLKQFTKLKLLLLHLKHHTGDFICRLCFKIFCRKENFQSHGCNKISPYACELCDKKFTQKKYLYRHRVAIHQQKYSCSNCKKSYYSNAELQGHNCSQIPPKDKEKFICSICDKIFYRSLYLRKHLRTHYKKTSKGLKSNTSTICEVCGQFLENKNSYYLHIKIHKQPIYSCTVCTKKFYRQDSLNAHIISKHKKVAEVECNICSKKLKSKKNLQEHVKTKHCNNVLKCKLCPETFKYRSVLSNHLKTIHQERQSTASMSLECYTCPVCKKGIKLRSSLLRHLKKLHCSEYQNINMSTIKPQTITVGKSIIPKAIQQNDTIACNGNNNEITAQINDLMRNVANDLSKGSDSYDNIVEDTSSGSASGSSKEVCLSIPDLTENDQEITLDKNAYILENGTIVQPQQDSANVIIYVLNSAFP